MTNVRRHGLTRVDVILCGVCATILLCLCALAFGQDEGNGLHPRTVKDGEQLQAIHHAMMIFAREFDDRFPRPGLIHRLADPELGRKVPGRGPEDVSLNTTANLYSCLIVQNYMRPELVISPVERNPVVKANKAFDYNAYNPVEDTYWDETFTADLKTGSNVSYAHQPIEADRVRTVWSNALRAELAQLGNRGPKDGKANPDSYTCGPHGQWAGNIVFGDNHVEFLRETAPERLNGDNLFARDEAGPRGGDSLLAFTKAIVDGRAELQFD